VNNPSGVNDSVEGILNVLEAGPVKNLFSPITKEIGETLGNFGSVVRFYSHRNLELIFTRWAESRRTPVGSEDFEKAMPLLPLAACVSDEELQDRWATLLESAVSTKRGFLPSFGRTLSELSPEEARYLHRLSRAASVRCHFAPDGIDIRTRAFSHSELVRIFDSTINTDGRPIEWEIPRVKVAEKEWLNAAKKAQAELVIQDFERLRIFEKVRVENDETVLSDNRQTPVERRPRSKSRTEFALTQYGVRFIVAITPLSIWTAWANDASIPTIGGDHRNQ